MSAILYKCTVPKDLPILCRYALKGKISNFEELLQLNLNQWQNFKYQVKVKLSMASIDEHGARWYSQSVPPPDDDTESSIELMSNTIAPAQKFTLTLSLIHLVILTQRSRILRCLIENLQENLTWEHEVYSWIELNKCRVELSISLY